MFKLKCLALPLFCFFAFTAVAQEGSQSGEAELSESLRGWAKTLNRDRHRRGFLLTPPGGNVSGEVRAAQKELERIIRYAGGEELENSNTNLMVNIYLSETPNAWVAEYSNAGTGEEKWGREKGTAWPVRGALGFADNDKPIVEIAISTGLLQLLEFEDELGFVMAHELTHFFEEHTRHSDHGHSQQHEVVADANGLVRILGKYEISAAISAFNKLFDSGGEIEIFEEDKAAVSALGSGAATTHHHEGQRISILQFLIERYRRTLKTAKRRDLTPLSKVLKLKTKPRKINFDLGDENFHLATAEYWRALDKYFLKGKIYYRVVNSRDGAEHEDLGKYSIMVSPSKKQVQDYAMEVLGKIKNSKITKTNKVNSFIQSLILFQRDNDMFNTFWKSMAERHLHQISRFLLENSVGDAPWKASDLDQINRGFSSSEIKHFIKVFLSEEKGQKVLFNLMAISEEWRAYYYSLFSLQNIVMENGLIDLELIDNTINSVFHVKPKAIEETYYGLVSGMVDKLVKLDPKLFLEAIKNTEYGSSKFKHLKYTLNRWANETEELQKSGFARKLIDYVEQQIEPVYFDDVIPMVRSIVFSSESSYDDKVDAYNSYIAGAGSLEYLSKDQILRAQEIIGEIARSFTFSRYADANVNFDDEGTKLIFKLLANDEIPLKERTNVFHWFSMNAKVQKNLFKENNEEARENLRKFFSEFSLEELIELLTDYPTALSEDRERFSSIINAESKEERLKVEHDLFKLENNDTFLEEDFIGYLQFKNVLLDTNLNMLKIFSYSGKSADRVGAMKKPEFLEILQALDSARNEVIHLDGMGHHTNLQAVRHRDSSKTLADLFIRSFDEISTFTEWKALNERVIFNVGKAFGWSLEQNKLIRKKILNLISKFSVGSQYRVIKDPNINKFLNSQDIARIASNKVIQVTKGRRDLNKLMIEVEKINKDFDLKDSMREAYDLFRERIAFVKRLQPHEVFDVFPEDDRSATEQTRHDNFNVRGMSGILSLTRRQPYESQVAMVEYLMGRDRPIPEFIELTNAELAEGKGGTSGDLYLASGSNFSTEIYKLREELMDRSELERSVVVNSFLTGPSGLFRSEDSRSILIEKILEPVEEKNKKIARILMSSLIEAEGESASVFLSYMLAQKNSDKPLTQSLILKSILDCYGVPGVKLAQYLAFTDEFKDFKDALESYQDEAMPISYYQMLLLVKERLGDKWDADRYRITRIKGSGSVNIAVEYFDKETKTTDILNISRKDIEIKSEEDFYRFENLLNSLGNSEDNEDGQFDFVIGLMQVIKKSVSLEFDKPHAFNMQKGVQTIYNREVDGWKVKSVDAYEVMADEMSILMEKAQGVSARKVLNSEPLKYKEAMAALLKVEMESLRGVDETGNNRPVSLFANPDLHDGQVLIDVGNKVVTVLDFGQVAPISNEERLLAIDLLRIVSGAETVNSSKRLLRRRLRKLYPDFNLDKDLIEEVLSHEGRMDMFVHLVSLLNRKGYELPISSVHWVLSANRIIKLGEKINVPYDKTFKSLILGQKLGLPLSWYNTGVKLTTKYNEQFGAEPKAAGSCSSLL